MKLLWLVLIAPFIGGGTSFAKSSEHLQARLISEASSASAGASFMVGIDFVLEKGWHVYWQNPGDYGDAPAIDWKDHPDFKASEILWPVPKKIQVGDIVSFGYEDEVILPFEVTLSPSLTRSSVAIEPQVRWLVCKDICIPGKATLKLNIPIQPSGLTANESDKARLDVVKKMLPTSLPSIIQSSGTLTSDSFVLKLSGVSPQWENIGLFPVDGDDVNYAVATQMKRQGSNVELTLKRSDRLVKAVTHFPALLVLSAPGLETASYTIDIPIGSKVSTTGLSLLLPILFAFLGGLLLNLMPCVFPVLSIKAMSVLKMAGETRRHVRSLGWAYTLGILVSFWLLVGTLVFLRKGGEQIGWGFQLQSPQFVFVLCCVLFAFGLNLLGFFEISGKFVGMGDSLARRSGWTGSFFTGVLATVVATPCSAPFMGSAIGFALSQSVIVIFLVFTALGLGLALPYLLICYLPGIGKVLPRPGAWMETFKQAMAFFIFGTVLWLSWVLSLQVNSNGPILLLSAFFGIGFSVWIATRFKRSTLVALAISVALVTWATRSLKSADHDSASSAQSGQSSGQSSASNGLQWEKFSPEKVAQYQAENRPVFVDFTAAWCVSCQVNEALVFRSDAIQQELKKANFALLKADWTNQDPIITQALRSFGRDGVPFYLIYPKGKNVPAVPLPEVINAGLVLTELEKLK